MITYKFDGGYGSIEIMLQIKDAITTQNLNGDLDVTPSCQWFIKEKTEDDYTPITETTALAILVSSLKISDIEYINTKGLVK